MSHYLQSLNQLVATKLDVEPSWVRLQKSKLGKFNQTYFVDAADRELVLRIAPPEDRSQMLFYEHLMMHQEPALHRLIRQENNVPVPEIIHYDFTRDLIPCDYLIMERLPGVSLAHHCNLTGTSVELVFHQVGEYLAQIHAITAEKYGYVGDHHPMDPQDDWASAFHVMWNLLLDDIENCQGYDRMELRQMRSLLDHYMSYFARPIKASLLHMDIWQENILASPTGQVTALLDWDRALWGDPEIEFAVMDYCGMCEPAFWQGYGTERDESDEAQVRKVFYLLYEIQKYIVIRRTQYHDPVRADEYRQQALQIASLLPS